MKSLAAILTAFNEPLELREIEWGYAQFGQVFVRIISSGICGAQLQEIRGEKGTILPRIMGHEGVGIVEEISPGVTCVKKGQKVVCHWRKGNGVESPSPIFSITDSPQEVETFRRLTSGQVTTFATHCVISENRLTPIPDDTPNDFACLLGCGLSTALGVIENEANLKIGESVLIIGCGGLGMNLILAAKIRGASRIEVMESAFEKEQMAFKLGATCFGQYLKWHPSDVVIDTTGNTNAIEMGMDRLAPSGRFIMVGQPKPRENVMLTNARHLFDGTGKTIMATQGGRFSPSQDIPRYIEAYRAGRIDLTGIVSHRMPLTEVNAALDLVRNGQAGRIMIDFQL